SVESDGPPKRAGAPQTEAENQRGEAGGQQPDGRLAFVAAVNEAEEDRDDDGRGPKAQGEAVPRFKSPPIDAGKAAGKRVLHEAAREVFLQQADEEKAAQPDRSETGNVAGMECGPVNNQETRFHQDQYENGKAGYSPGKAGKKARKLVAAAEAVDGVGASLDLRHDPGDKEHGKEHDALADEYVWREHEFRSILRGLVSARVE